MNVDGRAIAEEICAQTKERAARIAPAPKIVAYLLGEQTPATRSYLTIKKKSAEASGCVFVERATREPLATDEIGIVQLPTLLSQEEINALLIPEKDADVLSNAARVRFEQGEPGALLPPVVAAIAEILTRHNIPLKGKRAAVIGEGFLVGAPVATWLRLQGAIVSVITLESGSLSALADAEIVISGAGSPHLIKPEMLAEGVVLIDAGTSESSGKAVGDADPACATKCSLYTPVPGGVGPIAVAKLFENATILAERNLYF